VGFDEATDLVEDEDEDEVGVPGFELLLLKMERDFGAIEEDVDEVDAVEEFEGFFEVDNETAQKKN
jgi:hypothetical protein